MATVPPFRSEVDKTIPDQKEKPLEYYDLTGLTWGQLTRLSIMVVAEIDSITKPGEKKSCSRWTSSAPSSWKSC